jgi:rhodanese-related sulfurtransferase
VNCAGRTRSIIGAQSLINAGIPNPVMALRNGTMGWHLAGFDLERGAGRYLPQVRPDLVERARAQSAQVAERFPATHIDRPTLDEWRQRDTRSVFVLDVRSPEEYEAGHIPGSVCAPGGQLVQATDRYVGTLRARLVLVDDDGVRATMAASWLAQLGLHEVVVLDGGLLDAPLERGPQPVEVLGLESLAPPCIDVASLSQRLAGDRVAVMDLERSVAFKRGHIPGAVHAVRGRLDERTNALPPHDLLVLTCGDGLLARLAVEEATRLTPAEVVVLEGGTDAWRAAGQRLVAGGDGLEDAPVDAFLRPYDRDKAVEEAMQSYLDWEIALVEQMQRDGTMRFRVG